VRFRILKRGNSPLDVDPLRQGRKEPARPTLIVNHHPKQPKSLENITPNSLNTRKHNAIRIRTPHTLDLRARCRVTRASSNRRRLASAPVLRLRGAAAPALRPGAPRPRARSGAARRRGAPTPSSEECAAVRLSSSGEWDTLRVFWGVRGVLQSTQIGNATVAYPTFKRRLIHIFAL
jgi:hypothetical protein